MLVSLIFVLYQQFLGTSAKFRPFGHFIPISDFRPILENFILWFFQAYSVKICRKCCFHLFLSCASTSLERRPDLELAFQPFWPNLGLPAYLGHFSFPLCLTQCRKIAKMLSLLIFVALWQIFTLIWYNLDCPFRHDIGHLAYLCYSSFEPTVLKYVKQGLRTIQRLLSGVVNHKYISQYCPILDEIIFIRTA